MSLLTAAKHEVKQVGVVTLYFMFCFAVILTLKKLFLAEYQIEFYALSAVVVGALVAGLSFLGYHLFVAADSRLGEGTLWRALWERE